MAQEKALGADAHTQNRGDISQGTDGSENEIVKRRGRPPKDAQTVETHRIQITLTDPLYERLGALKKKTGATSTTDVFRNALRFYEAVVEELEGGKRLIIEDPKNPAIRTRLHL